MHNKDFRGRMWKGWQCEGKSRFHEDVCLGLGMFLRWYEWFSGACPWVSFAGPLSWILGFDSQFVYFVSKLWWLILKSSSS